MDTPNTTPNPQLELFKSAPKKDQHHAKAAVKAMFKRMEKDLHIGMFWVNDAQVNMPRTDVDSGDEE